MKIFKKRETVIQNMTFISIMSAINCVLLLLTSFLPYLRLLLTLSLPFASLVVTITCKKRFYPLYSLVTIGLCLLVSLNEISSIIFYIIPSLLSGFIFGFCLEKEIPSSYSILYSSFVYVICSYIDLIICEFIILEPIQDLYFTVFNLNDFVYKEYLPPIFIFSIGMIQSSLSYLFIKNASKMLGYEEKIVEDQNFVFYFLGFTLLTLISIFVKEESYLMFVGFSIYTFIHMVYNFYKSNKKLCLFSCVGAFISTFFIFAILYTLIETRFAIVILLIPLFIVGIIVIINNCFVKRKNK